MTQAPISATEAPAARADQITVYYDGSCALCSVEIGHYARQHGAERLCFVDVSAPGVAMGDDLERSVALRRFHIRQANGGVISGARAFVAIWETLPGWRLAARIARIPGVIALLELGYRLFLPTRPLLARIARALGAEPHRPCDVSPAPEGRRAP